MGRKPVTRQFIAETSTGSRDEHFVDFYDVTDPDKIPYWSSPVFHDGWHYPDSEGYSQQKMHTLLTRIRQGTARYATREEGIAELMRQNRLLAKDLYRF